jgi:hypothetical protein
MREIMYGKIPKETLAELLHYINEKENLESIGELGTVSREDLRVALRELANQLKVEAAEQEQTFNLTELKEVKDSFRKLLGALNEREKKLLMKGLLG